MTAKQYLRQLARLQLNIQILTEELEERRTRLTSTAAPQLGDKVQTSPQGDAFAAAMAALVDKDQQRLDLIFEYELLRDKIVAQILGLSNEMQSRVLYARYVQQKRWDTIATEQNYSIQRIFQIHGNALVEFARKYIYN
jgi:hypothetical protein